MGRDAVLAGGSRDPTPERPLEQRCWGDASLGQVPSPPGTDKRESGQMPRMARREARAHRATGASQ